MSKLHSRLQTLIPRTLALLVLAAAFLPVRPAAAQTCDRNGCGRLDCASPAKPVQASLWGNLQPVDPTPLPSERDTSNFNEFKEPYFNRNWFYGVDVENGWVFAGLAHGIAVFDASNPASPTMVAAKRYGPFGSFPFIPAGESSKIVFAAIDAPDDTVAAIAGYNGAGLLVFDLANKAQPKPVYQNVDKTSESVYATKINGTRYAFMASTAGLFVYNLDAAVAGNPCIDDGTPGVCPGVRLGQIPTEGTPYFVHGTGNYIAVGLGSSFGVEIFDISGLPVVPQQAQRKLKGLRNPGGRPVQGVALWSQGGNLYLGGRLGRTASLPAQTAIFDVSCVTTSSCSGLGAPLSALELSSASTSEYLTFSRAGTKPFLYVGGDTSCSGADGQQREWLLDVSNPSSPVDVTPQGTASATGNYGGVDLLKTINYWSAYYRGSPTGFNLVAPRAGKFVGDYFYRAGRSILDVHRLALNSPPVGNFEWSPEEIYPGTPVTFSDLSTGGPISWIWAFPDGTPPTSSQPSPVVSFSSPGTKGVALTPGNPIGLGDTVFKNVVVLDPNPAGTLAAAPPPVPPASLTTVTVCQQVAFTASATGAPPLTYTWEVLDPLNNPVAGPVNDDKTFEFASAPGANPGIYTGKVTVSNAVNPTGVALTRQFQINALPALTDISGQAPTAAFTTNVVTFTAPTHQGATSWVWSYGDGVTETFTDADEGKSPTHVYASVGQYVATVKISNCVNQTGFTSQPVNVNVTQTTPLNAAFQAGVFCQFGQCFATVGQAVPFVDSSTGAQFYDYDWNHNSATEGTCNFTDNDHTSPVTSHTYTTAAASGVFPCLRVRRGAGEQDIFVHGKITVEGGGGGGGGTSITIGGASAGQINQGVSFTASASGCTPASSGWSWTTGGGSGASTTNSITITWATAGSKQVTATNTNCGSAQGARFVTITDPNGGGGGGGGGGGALNAQFSFSPGAPKPGETVTFDASASTGNPATYAWDFGDGGQGSGKTVTHTFNAPGSYGVRLTVATSGCLSAGCVRDTLKTLVVSGPPPPPPVSAEFAANVECINVGGFSQCQAATGQVVTLTGDTPDAATYSWDFGDGKTGSGRSITHSWNEPDSYLVSLTVVKGESTATKTRTFFISGEPVPTVKTVVLPWIAQTRAPLLQSSDLYVHNPGTTAMEVTLEFRKRGTPESNPPRVKRTIQPGATLYAGDVLLDVFDRENLAGFISVTAETGDSEPVVTSFNTTFPTNGQEFGQAVAGVSMSQLLSAAGGEPEDRLRHLVGLMDTTERLSYFGLSNPNEEPVTYHLRFFDKTGKQIGESSQDLILSRFGQRQFQVKEIHETFGVSNADDYRVEFEVKSGGRIIPYASNQRLSTEDPSFLKPGTSTASKLYLVGVLSAPGLNDTTWQTDVLLTNLGGQPVTADVTFTSLGFSAQPTPPVHVTLQPGKTERLENVVSGELAIKAGGIGVLTVTSTSPGGVFPIVQGESYENSDPERRFGQAMSAVSDAEAAGPGQAQYLVGLQQDAKNRTTFWVFNNDGVQAEYDIVYRALDGKVLGTTAGVKLGAGKIRQFSPGQHPLPPEGVADGFTVQILVKSGKVLSAAQVINNVSNDPAYIQGETR